MTRHQQLDLKQRLIEHREAHHKMSLTKLLVNEKCGYVHA